MKETIEDPERRRVKDRRRGFERRDPESDRPRVPGHCDRRWPGERRHGQRREADRVAARSGQRTTHG